MTKKEFIEKYHDSVVRINMVGIVSASYRSMENKVQAVIDACKRVGLNADYSKISEALSPSFQIYIYQSIPSRNAETTKVDYDEFKKDYLSIAETEKEQERIEAEKAVQYVISLLNTMEIDFEGVPKKIDMMPNAAQETGFIQGYSSNRCSLWWHPDGSRIFFLIGRGCFELSKYSYKSE